MSAKQSSLNTVAVLQAREADVNRARHPRARLRAGQFDHLAKENNR